MLRLCFMLKHAFGPPEVCSPKYSGSYQWESSGRWCGPSVAVPSPNSFASRALDQTVLALWSDFGDAFQVAPGRVAGTTTRTQESLMFDGGVWGMFRV